MNLVLHIQIYRGPGQYDGWRSFYVYSDNPPVVNKRSNTPIDYSIYSSSTPYAFQSCIMIYKDLADMERIHDEIYGYFAYLGSGNERTLDYTFDVTQDKTFSIDYSDDNNTIFSRDNQKIGHFTNAGWDCLSTIYSFNLHQYTGGYPNPETEPYIKVISNPYNIPIVSSPSEYVRVITNGIVINNWSTVPSVIGHGKTNNLAKVKDESINEGEPISNLQASNFLALPNAARVLTLANDGFSLGR